MVSTLDCTELLLPISRAQYLVTCPLDEIERFAAQLPERDAITAVVRGDWCPTKPDAIWEIAVAMKFPAALRARNWKTLRQGLLDLSWNPASSYTLFIANSDQMLDQADGELSRLVEVLQSVMRERNRWDERALRMTSDRVPLHVVFHCECERRNTTLQRLVGAGLDLKVAVPWWPKPQILSA